MVAWVPKTNLYHSKIGIHTIPKKYLGCAKPRKQRDKLPYQVVSHFFHQQYHQQLGYIVFLVAVPT